MPDSRVVVVVVAAVVFQTEGKLHTFKPESPQPLVGLASLAGHADGNPTRLHEPGWKTY